MQEYNNRLRMRDLFMNPKLAGVFPQFEPGERLQNVYSFAQTEKRVRDYLVAALNGKITADGNIAVARQTARRFEPCTRLASHNRDLYQRYAESSTSAAEERGAVLAVCDIETARRYKDHRRQNKGDVRGYGQFSIQFRLGRA